MTYYAAIDLHSNNGFLTVIDETDRVLRRKKLPNVLGGFVSELEPFRTGLTSVAVESTFNWYWLVDGLAADGFPMVLVNTAAVKQFDGLKHGDDESDSFSLARMSRLGILPTAYIYPKQERPTRDLLRKRSSLVQQRTSNLLSIENLEQRNRAVRRSTKEIKKLTEEEIDQLYESADLSLAIKSTLRIVNALSSEIAIIEAQVSRKARLREEYRLLQTVWGIGEILALAIMYESGPMSRFATVGDYVSYCRLVEAKSYSNGKVKGANNAKNGNAWLSWAFSEAAHFAIRNYPAAKAFYDRKLRQRNRILALRALAHKLARASFYVLKRQEAFDSKKLFG